MSAPTPSTDPVPAEVETLRQAEALFNSIIDYCMEQEEIEFPNRQRQENDRLRPLMEQYELDNRECQERGEDIERLPPRAVHIYRKAALVKLTHAACEDKAAFLRFCFIALGRSGSPPPADTVFVSAHSPEFEQGVRRFSAFAPESLALTERLQQVRLDDGDIREEARKAIDNFADELVRSFYTPFRAAGGNLGRSLGSNISSLQVDGTVGTPKRNTELLKQKCMERDRFRCLVTGNYDMKTYVANKKRCYPSSPRDADGNRFGDTRFARLQLSHIIPRSVMITKVDNLSLVC